MTEVLKSVILCLLLPIPKGVQFLGENVFSEWEDTQTLYFKALTIPSDWESKCENATIDVSGVLVHLEGWGDHLIDKYSLDNEFPVLNLRGYIFNGWYDTAGNKIADENGNQVAIINSEITLTPNETIINYSIDYVLNGGSLTNETTSYNVEQSVTLKRAIRSGYYFVGWYTNPSFSGTAVIKIQPGTIGNKTFYAKWEAISYSISYILNGSGNPAGNPTTYTIEDDTINLLAPTGSPKTGYKYTWSITQIPKGSTGNKVIYANSTPISYITYWNYGQNTGIGFPVYTGDYRYYDVTYSYSAFDADEGYEFSHWQATRESDGYSWNIGNSQTVQFKNLTTIDGDRIDFEPIYTKKKCIATGTLITLADGSQKPVESLTGDELLLVWNMQTGKFESAPILFIDQDPESEYKVINLYFSDGTQVKVITEHGFFDFDLNQYVFLREDAAQYIGHWFNKQVVDADGKLIWTRVQLVNVDIKYEITGCWSPVTYGHLCYYVNGMLSVPGATEGLINIFEVNGENMQIDQSAFIDDIETYGIFSYEEFCTYLPVPKIVFDAFNGQYLKVAIGKNLISWETLTQLVQEYIEFFKI